MNFTYENQGTNTHLVYTVSAEENIDSMSLGMLTNNKIPGLAVTLFTQMDSTKYIKYNVSAHIPVSQFFAGAVNKKRLIGVFKGIVAAILSAEDYMLDEGSILLDLDYIFADVTTCDTVLICLPIENKTEHHDLGAFFKGIMFSTQFDQTENCDHVAKIINYLNSSPLFSLSDFSTLLDTIEKNDGNTMPVSQSAQSQTAQTVRQQETVESKPVAQPQAQIQVQQSANRPLNIPSGYTAVQSSVQPKVPVTQAKVSSQDNDSGKGKGFSLFGFRSSKINDKEKKESPSKQSTKQPVKQTQRTSFEVPGQSAPPLAFEVPGQPATVNAQTVASSQQVKPVQQPERVKPESELLSDVVSATVQATNKPLSFGETTVLGGGAIGETTVLGAGAAPVKNDPHLIRSKNNEKIPLNKPVFRIGKERSYVDYFISDNTAISRSHANIINHNGEFFVVDTNSTNHTYVNGGMIHSNEEVKLSHGTKIRFANEDFEFRMY